MTIGRRIGYGLGLLLLGVLVVIAIPGKAQAEGLQIRPLLYTQRLQAGEAKRGFVDVSNATHTPVTVALKVQAFRQLDGRGTLEFFDSEPMRGAVQLDLTEVDLGPSEAVRVYFQIDSSKLPAGDNFAAIFAATRVESADGGAAPSAQVGTLLILENGAGGPHKAEVTKVSAPLISFSGTLHASAEVHNTGKPKQASAFFPELTTSVGPWFGASTTVKGPLVFSGITREAPVSVETKNMLGFYRLTIAANDGAGSRWLLLVTGVWRWILLLLVAAAAGLYMWSRRYKLELQWVSSQRFPRRHGRAKKPEGAGKDESGAIVDKDVVRVPDSQNRPNKTELQSIPTVGKNYPQKSPLKPDANNTTNVAKKTTKRHKSKALKTKAKKTTKNSKKH